MSTAEATLTARIKAFAASVRAELDDLPAEEVDEIVTGLIADLTDQAADNDGELDLGDPAVYAAELRSAAGLPERSATAKRPPVSAQLRTWANGIVVSIRGNRTGAAILDFLIALRPVWWVARGLGMYAILAMVAYVFTSRGTNYPRSFWTWVLAAALVVVSVQWGRGKWLPRNAWRHVRTIVSIVAILVLPSALINLTQVQYEYVYDSEPYPDSTPEPIPDGLLLDGVQVGNIFAYDANGEPLSDVQLYTDKGTPLNLYGTNSSTSNGSYTRSDGLSAIPWQDSLGRSVWNVFPLQLGDLENGEWDEESQTWIPQQGSEKDETAPFVRAPNTIEPSPAPTDPAADGSSTDDGAADDPAAP